VRFDFTVILENFPHILAYDYVVLTKLWRNNYVSDT